MRRPAKLIAGMADRRDLERLGIIPMVVYVRILAAVNANQCLRLWQLSPQSRAANKNMSTAANNVAFLPAARARVALAHDIGFSSAELAGVDHAARPHKSGRRSANFTRPPEAAAIFFANSGEGLR